MNCLSKALLVAAVVAVACPVASAVTPDASTGGIAASAAVSPLLGSWSLDTSRLPMAPEQRPKSVRFTFDDAGAGKWITHVDIVYASGEESHSVSTAALDGTYAAIENSPEADHVALERPVPNVLVMALQKGGVLVSTRIYAASPGGSDLVETVVYPGGGDRPVMRTNYFRRVRQSG